MFDATPHKLAASIAMRALPEGTVIRFRCEDCSTETADGVDRLVREARLGHLCAFDLVDILYCQRGGCGGSLLVALDLGE